MRDLDQESFYADMQSHSCYISGGNVIINWDNGSVAILITWFISMVRHLLNCPDFIGVKENVLRI